MEFQLNTTLQNAALAKLGGLFLKHEKEYLKELLYTSNRAGNLSESTLAKIDHFPLSELLKDKLKNVVRYMELELKKWRRRNKELVNLESVQIVANLRWTTKGNIAMNRTLANILKNSPISVEDRFSISCHYCLEEAVIKLWGELLPDAQERFLSSTGSRVKEYWSAHLGHELLPSQAISKISFYSCLMEATYQGNVLALIYFWEKLPPAQKNDVLKHHTVGSKVIEMLYHSSVKLSVEDKVLKANGIRILKLFLDNWSWGNTHFFVLFDSCQRFLTEDEYLALLEHIVALMKLYPAKGELQSLLRAFWIRNKAYFNANIVQDPWYCKVLPRILAPLYNMEEWESLKMIVEDIPDHILYDFPLDLLSGVKYSLLDQIRETIFEPINDMDLLSKYQRSVSSTNYKSRSCTIT